MHQTLLSLTGLEIFFICSTIISLVFNLLQWRYRKASKEPLSNSLVAIFNDIKSKTNGVFLVYNALFNLNNPHKDINTLRWEYGLFAQSVIGYLQGFQEQLFGVLVSLKPEDKGGQQAFRATDYGLTEQEKELREQYFQQHKATNAAPANQESQSNR
ncbi:MAG: hypothetical protein IH874_06645 [Candidatus Dadabacteria bacterium]|nr:hypothetical protein [Candidatus Dadabacteria bacterium]